MRRTLALFAACLLAVSPAAPAVGACRLGLVLGLDVSGSVDAGEYRLQLDGVAAALEARAVQQALFAMPQAHVELTVYQWGGAGQQHLLLDWTPLRTPEDTARVAARLRGSTLRFSDPATAIGAAMTFGTRLMRDRTACWQHTLDISGDGPSNAGPHPGGLRWDGRVTINALVINPQGRANTDKDLTGVQTLEEHYRTHVIRGPGSFVETAADFDNFRAAMTRKLLREVQVIAVSRNGARQGR